MQTIRIEKETINRALLDEELRAGLGDKTSGYNSRMPYPGWVDVLLVDYATQEDIDTATAVVAAHDSEGQTPAQVTIANLTALAQSAVGVEITALTDAQRWAMLGVLLWKAGAIAPDATIKPLGQWVG